MLAGIMSSISTWVLFILILLVPCTASAQTFWQSTAGPYVGSGISLVSDSMGRIFVGEYAYDTGLGAAVWVLDDNGESWKQTSFSGKSDIRMEALAATADGAIFLGSKYLRSEDELGSIIRSYDGGVTWEQVGFTDAEVHALLSTSVADTAILLGATGEGIRRSIDKGESWITVAYPESGIYDFAQGSADSLYAVGIFSTGYTGIIRSADYGKTWSAPVQLPSFGRVVATVDAGEILVGTDGGILYSDDFGETWSERGLDNKSVKALFVTSDGTWLAGTPQGVYRSSDRGVTWTSVSMLGDDLEVYAFHETVAGYLFVLTSEGIFRTTESAGRWAKVGLPRSYVDALAFNPEGALFAGGSDLYLRVPETQGAWREAAFPGMLIRSIAFTDDYTYAASSYGTYRSSDEGDSWVQLGPGNVDLSDFAVASDEAVYAATSFDHIYRFTDQDTSGTMLDQGLEGRFNQLAINDQDILVTGNSNGFYRFDTESNSWIRTGVPDETCVPNCDVADLVFAGNSTLYAIILNQVYKTIDFGATWTLTAFPDVGANVLAVDEKGWIFVGTPGKGVYQSKDGGQTWIHRASGLPESYGGKVSIESLTVGPHGFLYAGTAYRGVYKSAASVYLADIEVPGVPNTFNVTNFPNPFQDATTVRFTLSRPGNVSISIFDVLGRKVQTLLERRLATGTHRVVWKAEGQPAGIYFLRITAEEHSQVRKLVRID